jgi:hypothetical protein
MTITILQVKTYVVAPLSGPNLFLSSQTDKLIAATKFYGYLGLKRYKKAKKLKHFIHLRLAYWPQSLSTYHSISTTRILFL